MILKLKNKENKINCNMAVIVKPIIRLLITTNLFSLKKMNENVIVGNFQP
jgi:hypothetical protein